MENNQNQRKSNNNHAPGAGSDKQHPETPPKPTESSKNSKKGNIQDNPGSQNTG